MRFDEKYYLDIFLFYRILANDMIVAKNTKNICSKLISFIWRAIDVNDYF
jgi:hypothetical protein